MTHDEPCSMAPDDKHDLISGTCSHLPWLIGYQFFKQLATMFMSVWAGSMYEVMGFRETYLVLGIIAATFTFISIFTLSGMGPLGLLKGRTMVSKKAASY
ncbi:MFS transporter [Aeromonas caviae]|nr:MFS transporter [Aeromonas caviae]